MTPTHASVIPEHQQTISRLTDLPGAAMRQKILSDQRRDHRFFLTFAIISALTIVWGFSGTYYLKPLQAVGVLRPSPQLNLLLHVHGAIFTLWLFFYVTQTALVSGGRRRLHMKLGWASAAFIPIMVTLGTIAVFWGAKMGHKQNWPTVESAAMVNIVNGFLFAALASAGILLRKKPETHKRLMLLSLVTLMPPALARSPLVQIPVLVGVAIFAFLLAGPIYDIITRRRLHPVYLICVPILIVTGPPARIALSHTQVWHHLYKWALQVV
jgi:hypothetical protein